MEIKGLKVTNLKVCECGNCGTNFIVDEKGNATIIEKNKGKITQEDYNKNPKLKRLKR